MGFFWLQWIQKKFPCFVKRSFATVNAIMPVLNSTVGKIVRTISPVSRAIWARQSNILNFQELAYRATYWILRKFTTPAVPQKYQHICRRFFALFFHSPFISIGATWCVYIPFRRLLLIDRDWLSHRVEIQAITNTNGSFIAYIRKIRAHAHPHTHTVVQITPQPYKDSVAHMHERFWLSHIDAIVSVVLIECANMVQFWDKRIIWKFAHRLARISRSRTEIVAVHFHHLPDGFHQLFKIFGSHLGDLFAISPYVYLELIADTHTHSQKCLAAGYGNQYSPNHSHFKCLS